MIGSGGRPPSTEDEAAPVFRVLSEGRRRRIHEAALELLSDPGVRITTAEARQVLLDAGCASSGEDILRIPARLVEDAIARAPATFTLFDRDGRERAFLGEGRTYFGAGVTSLNFQDPSSGETHSFTLQDMADVARLTDALPNLDFLSTPGVVRPAPDLPLQLVNQHEFLAMVSNTTKPLMPLVADGDSLADVFEMAAIVAGGREELRARPFLVPYLNSVTPLTFNTETLDKLLLSADWGIPVSSQSAPNIGATTPVTVAATVALASAETLAGLVIAQQRRPGTPYLVGTMPMAMDMRSGQVVGGSPASFLAYLAGAEMARHWGLPQVGAGGSTDAKIPDEQAALEISRGIFADVLSGPDLSFDAGGMEMGLTHSAVLMTMVDEVIEECRRVMEGVPVDDESLGLDAIREAGIGGNFLGSQHTLAHFRRLWTPTMASWESRLDWEAGGSTTFGERARARTLELLATHRPERLPVETLEAMQAVIERRRSSLPPAG